MQLGTGCLILLVLGLVVNVAQTSPGWLVLAGIVAVVAVVLYSATYKEFDYICTNCGTKTKIPGVFGAPKTNVTDVCAICIDVRVIPITTPRGRELNELYHGDTSIEERLRVSHESAERLLGGYDVADELGKLAQLVQEGALTADEWQRAKDLVLGQPKDKQDEAVERVAKLYAAHKAGALTESEFNMTKWDILSRIGRV